MYVQIHVLDYTLENEIHFSISSLAVEEVTASFDLPRCMPSSLPVPTAAMAETGVTWCSGPNSA